jgi:hypothetical protein
MVSVAAIFFVLGFLRLLLAASPEGKDTRSSLSIFKRGIYLKGVNTAYSKGALTFSEAYLKLFSLAKGSGVRVPISIGISQGLVKYPTKVGTLTSHAKLTTSVFSL